MKFSFSPGQNQLRGTIAGICSRFDDTCWLDGDTTGAFPHAFHTAMAAGGCLGIATPEEYGGAGLGIPRMPPSSLPRRPRPRRASRPSSRMAVWGYSQDYVVERLPRGSLIQRIAPIGPHLILSFIAERVLGLPKSY
jgi:alkylation response protein AidB-like acyl-CoA dehydrogenase